MHCLFLAGWWPTTTLSLNGIFVKEHALAVGKQCQITVLYINSIKKPSSLKPVSVRRLEEKITDNLRIIGFDIELLISRYGVLKTLLKKILFAELKKLQKTTPVSILHLHILQSNWAAPAFAIAKKLNLPLALTEHFSFYHTEIFLLPEKKIVAKKKEVAAYLNNPVLKSIMPVSHHLASVLKENFNGPKNKFDVVPNIAHHLFTLSNTEKKPTDKINVLSTAIWQLPKNPLLFFEVLKQVKEKELTLYEKIKITWGGYGPQMEDIKNFVQTHLSDLDINFTGKLSKDQIANYMKCHDFLVHPSDSENLPCIIIESLCSGLPVLSVNINGVPELVNKTNGMLYKAKSATDFYNTFIAMCNNIPSFNRNRIASDARALYNEDVVGRQIFNIYKKILKS